MGYRIGLEDLHEVRKSDLGRVGRYESHLLSIPLILQFGFPPPLLYLFCSFFVNMSPRSSAFLSVGAALRMGCRMRCVTKGSDEVVMIRGRCTSIQEEIWPRPINRVLEEFGVAEH